MFFPRLIISCVNSYVLYAHNPQKGWKFITKVSLLLLQNNLKRNSRISNWYQRLSEVELQYSYPKLQKWHPKQANIPLQIKLKDVHFVQDQRTKRWNQCVALARNIYRLSTVAWLQPAKSARMQTLVVNQNNQYYALFYYEKFCFELPSVLFITILCFSS